MSNSDEPSITDTSGGSGASGSQPVWARSGLELFYVNGDQLMVTAVDAHSGFAASKPALLFQGGPLVGIEGDATYDVSLGGQRFVMIRTSSESLTVSGEPDATRT